MAPPCPSCSWPEMGRVYKELDGKMFVAAPGAQVNLFVEDIRGKQRQVVWETAYHRCPRCGSMVGPAGPEMDTVLKALDRSLGADRDMPALPKGET